MRLIGIDCQIPSNKISNESIIELINYHSSSRCSHLKELEGLVRKHLLHAGIESRFWRANNEKPIDLIRVAVENSLAMANLNLQNIDLVIYSSIDRGFIEPANAAFICKALGIKNVRNFDVVDACMGWASAVQVADSFLASSGYIRTVLIINAEFPMDVKGSVIPQNFMITDKQELHWKFASFTLGEGASACIFEKDGNRTKFEFIEDSSQADLCMIPLPNYAKYVDQSDRKFLSEDLQFYADGSSLLQRGMDSSVKVLDKLLNGLDNIPNLIFPHSVSYKMIRDAALKANVKDQIYSTFPQLGNLATASVPSSIKKALLNKKISKNEKGIAWIASAGMKYAAFELNL